MVVIANARIFVLQNCNNMHTKIEELLELIRIKTGLMSVVNYIISTPVIAIPFARIPSSETISRIYDIAGDDYWTALIREGKDGVVILITPKNYY